MTRRSVLPDICIFMIMVSYDKYLLFYNYFMFFSSIIIKFVFMTAHCLTEMLLIVLLLLSWPINLSEVHPG